MISRTDTFTPWIRAAFAMILCLGAALPARAQWQRDFGSVTSMSYSPDGRYLAACNGREESSLGELRVWDAKTGHLIHKVNYKDGIEDLAFSPDGKTLAVAVNAGAGHDSIRLWDLKTWKITKRMGGKFSPFTLAYTSEGRRIFVGSDWDENTKAEAARWIDVKTSRVHPLPNSEGRANLRVSEHYVVGAYYNDDDGDHENLRAWDLKGRFLWRMTQPGLGGFEFLPGGKTFLAAVGDEGEGEEHARALQIRDAATGKILVNLPQKTNMVGVTVSKDGRWWATDQSDELDNPVNLWDAKSRRIIKTLTRIGGAWDFSPDGHFLASADGSHVRVTKISR